MELSTHQAGGGLASALMASISKYDQPCCPEPTGVTQVPSPVQIPLVLLQGLPALLLRHVKVVVLQVWHSLHSHAPVLGCNQGSRRTNLVTGQGSRWQCYQGKPAEA